MRDEDGTRLMDEYPSRIVEPRRPELAALRRSGRDFLVEGRACTGGRGERGEGERYDKEEVEGDVC